MKFCIVSSLRISRIYPWGVRQEENKWSLNIEWAKTLIKKLQTGLRKICSIAKTFALAIKVLFKFCKNFYKLDITGKRDTIDAIKKLYKLKTTNETLHIHCTIPLFIFRRKTLKNLIIYLYHDNNIFDPIVFSGSIFMHGCKVTSIKMNKIFKTKNLPVDEIIRFWTAMKLAGKESMLVGFEKRKGALIYHQDDNFIRFIPSKQFYSRFFPTKKTITLNKLIELCLSKEQ